MANNLKNDRYPIFFRAFKLAQRLLRGSGLGKIKSLRALRDKLYMLVRPKSFLDIKIDGLYFRVDPSFTTVVPDLLLDEAYVKFESLLVRTFLKEGNVFIDMGANIGYFTVLAASIVKDAGRVISFEPEPRNFGFLKQNVKINGFTNVTILPKAVGDSNRQIELHVDVKATGGHQIGRSVKTSPTLLVEMVSLDEVLKDQSSVVNFMKMDIEGSEPLALRGMDGVLKENFGVKIITEFYPEKIALTDQSPSEYLELLRKYGFSFYLVDEREQKLVLMDQSELLQVARKSERINILCSREHVCI